MVADQKRIKTKIKVKIISKIKVVRVSSKIKNKIRVDKVRISRTPGKIKDKIKKTKGKDRTKRIRKVRAINLIRIKTKNPNLRDKISKKISSRIRAAKVSRINRINRKTKVMVKINSRIRGRDKKIRGKAAPKDRINNKTKPDKVSKKKTQVKGKVSKKISKIKVIRVKKTIKMARKRTPEMSLKIRAISRNKSPVRKSRVKGQSSLRASKVARPDNRVVQRALRRNWREPVPEASLYRGK